MSKAMRIANSDGEDICSVGRELGVDASGETIHTGDVILVDGSTLTVAVPDGVSSGKLIVVKKWYQCVTREQCNGYHYREVGLSEIIFEKSQQIGVASENLSSDYVKQAITDMATEIVRLLKS